jgi:hypothetical protein
LSANGNVDQTSDIDKTCRKCGPTFVSRKQICIGDTYAIAAIITRSVISLHGNCAAIIPSRGLEMYLDHPIIASHDSPPSTRNATVAELLQVKVRLPACCSATAIITDPAVMSNKPKKSNCRKRMVPSFAHCLFRGHTKGRTMAGIAHIGAL